MNYQKSIRYATKLTDKPRDLVHEAYIKWYEKTGDNLFDRQPGEIARVLKNIFFNQERNKQWSFRRVTHPKVFIDAGELGGEDFYDETEFFISQLLPFDREVLRLKIEGFRNGEIGILLNRSSTTITKAIKNIKGKMHIMNPFNGHSVKVVKRIKRKTYDENPKYKEEFEMGDKSDHNEYYTLMTSKTNPDEGLLIREGKDE